MNDRVLSVLSARKQAKSAQTQTQAAQRARSAAVSVSGSAPVGALQQPSTDVRSAIEAAIMQSAR
jgi:anti-sigma28 factor (negative regulator of flagellin synthesis)